MAWITFVLCLVPSRALYTAPGGGGGGGGGGRDFSEKVNDYTGVVGSILASIDDNTPVTNPSTSIDDWQNANLATSKRDAYAVYWLVTNGHAVFDTTTSQANQILTDSVGGETLATYYNLVAESALGTVADGVTTTGFATETTTDGIGSGDFLYVGGGSSAFETQFLGTSKTMTHVYTDGAALIRLTVRGTVPNLSSGSGDQLDTYLKYDGDLYVSGASGQTGFSLVGGRAPRAIRTSSRTARFLVQRV